MAKKPINIVKFVKSISRNVVKLPANRVVIDKTIYSRKRMELNRMQFDVENKQLEITKKLNIYDEYSNYLFGDFSIDATVVNDEVIINSVTYVNTDDEHAEKYLDVDIKPLLTELGLETVESLIYDQYLLETDEQ